MAKSVDEMNIYEKILKIADMAGVLQKNKDGFNYKYVTEEEIQAKVTAGMQKYHVTLLPSLSPGSLVVTPWQYQKPKTKKVKDQIIDYTIPVNELIVQAEVVYTWVNTDRPSDKVECRWAYIGQMEDAAQAFGAGATYGNRYYLLKALQLATTEADPDAYRSKQLKAEADADNRELLEAIASVTKVGTELISLGVAPEKISSIVSKNNKGDKNPSTIKNISACEKIKEEFEKLKKELK